MAQLDLTMYSTEMDETVRQELDLIYGNIKTCCVTFGGLWRFFIFWWLNGNRTVASMSWVIVFQLVSFQCVISGFYPFLVNTYFPLLFSSHGTNNFEETLFYSKFKYYVHDGWKCKFCWMYINSSSVWTRTAHPTSYLHVHYEKIQI